MTAGYIELNDGADGSVGEALAGRVDDFLTGDFVKVMAKGTWTPVVADAATAGNVATNGVETGRWTRFADVYFWHISLVNIDTTGMTAGNDLFLRGFPFTFATNQIFYGAPVGGLWTNGLTWASSAQVFFTGEPNTTYGRFRPLNSFAYENVSQITSGSSDIEIAGLSFID